MSTLCAAVSDATLGRHQRTKAGEKNAGYQGLPCFTWTWGTGGQSGVAGFAGDGEEAALVIPASGRQEPALGVERQRRHRRGMTRSGVANARVRTSQTRADFPPAIAR